MEYDEEKQQIISSPRQLQLICHERNSSINCFISKSFMFKVQGHFIFKF